MFAYANEQASKWPCVAANIYFACSLVVTVPGEQECVNLHITTMGTCSVVAEKTQEYQNLPSFEKIEAALGVILQTDQPRARLYQ